MHGIGLTPNGELSPKGEASTRTADAAEMLFLLGRIGQGREVNYLKPMLGKSLNHV